MQRHPLQLLADVGDTARPRWRRAARAATSPMRSVVARPIEPLERRDRRPTPGSTTAARTDRRGESPARDAAAADRARPTAAARCRARGGRRGRRADRRVGRDPLGRQRVDAALGVVARDLCRPVSITAVTPRTVSDVSAMLVATMTRRRSDDGESARSCSSASSEPCSGNQLDAACPPAMPWHCRSSRDYLARAGQEAQHVARWCAAGRPASAAAIGSPAHIRSSADAASRARRSTGQPSRNATPVRIERRRHDDDPQIVAPATPAAPARGRDRRGCCARGTRRG